MEWILLALSLPGLIFCVYEVLLILLGFFRKPKPIPYAVAQKKLAVLIPARNEARVIGRLVDSIKRQRYPAHLFDVFVIPNNCTDDTADVAKAAGAKVLMFQDEVHAKGDVLRLAFEHFEKTTADFDGYIIVDADNVVDPGFLQASNNALCAGYKAAQAYRDSKNPSDSWVSACTSVFFWFMNCVFNHSRAALGISASLNGTGILVSAALIQRLRYNTKTLTEDLELTAQIALAGERIAWMPEAITFDEQPTDLRDSFTQRRRWAAGNRQCMARYAWRLIFSGKGINAIDIGILFSAMLGQMLGLVPMLYAFYKIVVAIVRSPMQGLTALAWVFASTVLVFFFGGALFALVVCTLENKMKGERMLPACSMGWYLFTWFPANLLGCFARAPKWKIIPHTSTVGIDDCDRKVPERPAMVAQKKETETF